MACEECNTAKSDMLPSEWLGGGAPSAVANIEARVAKTIRVRFRSRRRGRADRGLSEEYYWVLVGLFERGDPYDMDIAVAAHRSGFGADDLFYHVGLVARMVDDEDFDAAMAQLRGIAAKIRDTRRLNSRLKKSA